MFTPSGVEAWAWFLPGFGYDICSNSTCIVVCCNERRDRVELQWQNEVALFQVELTG